jgi:predicted phage terminase large subunit-like protein
MKINKKEEYLAILRTDFVAFVERAFRELNPKTEFQLNWHIEVIAEALEQCRTGKLRRLIINVAPRSLKSHMTSISFVAWLLGHNPAARIACASYGQDLSEKLAGDCRLLMASQWYQDLFPETRLSTDKSAVRDFETTEKGSRIATSVGGAFTGRGGEFILIDDPLKPDEAVSETQRSKVNDWCANTLMSRLNDKRTGCIILIIQRLHEDDLVGHVLDKEQWKVLRFAAIAEDDENYVINSPYGTRHFQRRAGEALHPEREPLEALNQLCKDLGEYNFAGQYQQAPAPLGGGLVKAEWFKTYTVAEKPAQFDVILQSWDTANKSTERNDYSVCTTWGVKDNHVYLLHVFRKRLDYPDLKRKVRELEEVFHPQTILIEDQGSGIPLIQELVNEGMQSIKKYKSTLEKIVRMNSVTSVIENGFVHLPEKELWLDEYLHELTIFPNGKYDDQADSTSQALDWVKDSFAEQFRWLRIRARRVMIAEGRLEEVREMDKKYGPPPGEPELAAPSGPVVDPVPGKTQKSSGPCVYVGPEGEDPDSRRLKRCP